MLEQSLATRSVTMETKQAQQGQGIEQYVQYELGHVDRARSIATIKQGESTVKTELVGTPGDTYSRFLSVDTTQKGANGKALDFSKVEGVWVKNETGADGAAQPLFAQAVIGFGVPMGSVPVPIGAVSTTQRAELMKYIKESGVYGVSFKDATKKRVNGRLEYSYTVKIQTILYARMMKSFAGNLGLSQLDNLDPNQYAGAEPMTVQLTVDALSRQLVAVRAEGAGYTVRYSSYDVPLRVDIPTKSISNEELQKRLGEL